MAPLDYPRPPLPAPLLRIPSRHLQIARAYFTPWPARLWVIFVIAFATFTFCVHKANYPAQFAILMLGGSLATWAGPVIAAEAKEHIADPRSHLTPGYRGPHLLVACTIFLLATVGIAALTFWQFARIPTATGWPEAHVKLDGYLAIVLVLAVLLAWMAHTQSPIFIFGTMIAAAAAFVTPAQNMTFAMIGGAYPLLSYGLIVASLAGLFLLGWRLAHLHEEMFEYFRIDSTALRPRRLTTGDRQLRRAAALEAGGATASLRGAYRLDQPLASVATAGFLRRVVHWRFVTAAARGNFMLSIGVAIILLGLYALIPEHDEGARFGVFVAVGTCLSGMLPILVTAVHWPNRWLVLGTESLRPARSRQAFFAEQISAMAIDLLSLWFWFLLGVVADVLIMEPRWMLAPQTVPLIVLIFAAQFWFFGVTLWVLRLRVGILATFFTLMIEIIGTAILFAWQVDAPRHQPMHTPSLLLAAGMAVVGILITLDAYRRWLRTDLD